VAGSGTKVARGLGLIPLLLGPLVIALDRLDAAGELTLFVLAGAALITRSSSGQHDRRRARHSYGPNSMRVHRARPRFRFV
jgi:hypothetical protein